MIIGTGSLAKLIQDREDVIFFCSGVGNSSCVDEHEFAREYYDLESIKWADDCCLFYFSSISAWKFPEANKSKYFTHKRVMESSVKSWFKNCNIVRLGNIWECTNPNTFLNYMAAHPEAPIRDEYKYMISAQQLNMVLQGLPLTGHNEISIFGEMLTVKECLKRTGIR